MQRKTKRMAARWVPPLLLAAALVFSTSIGVYAGVEPGQQAVEGDEGSPPQPPVITAVAALVEHHLQFTEADAPQSQEALPLPAAVEATVDGATEDVPVAWTADTPYTGAPGTTTFTAVPGQGYALAEGLAAPAITVTVSSAAQAPVPARADVSVTVDLDGYSSFQLAVEALVSASPQLDITAVTTLKITGQTTGDGRWTADDGVYLRNNFTSLVVLDLGGFTGRFGYRAFSENTTIEEAILPTGKDVTSSMFDGCTSLSTLWIEGGTRTPGLIDLTDSSHTGKLIVAPFWLCTSITAVKIPADATLNNSFQGCPNLTTLWVEGGTRTGGLIDLTGFAGTIGASATGIFKGCPSITAVQLPAGFTIWSYMFQNCTSLTTLWVEDGARTDGVIDLRGIGSYTGEYIFSGCTAITAVHLPAGNRFGNNMFEDCTRLTTLWVEGGTRTDGVIDLTGIGSYEGIYIFADCTAITTARLPADIPIGKLLFQNCTSLSTLTTGGMDFLPGVVDLSGYTAASFGDGYTFQSCSSITAVKLPSAISTIPEYMFSNCGSLSTVVFVGGDAPSTVGTGALSDVAPTGTLYYPAGATDYGTLLAAGLPPGWQAVATAAPAITRQPTGQSQTAGGTVRFSVAAGGQPAPTYQWQLSGDGTVWNNIGDGGAYSGATTDTLVVAGVMPGQNGLQYRCVLTNIVQSTVSNAALLTVTQPAINVSATGLDSLQVGRAVTGARVVYALSGGSYTYADPITAAHFAIAGLPGGLTAGDAHRVDDYTVEITITGAPTAASSAGTILTCPASIPASNIQGALLPAAPTGFIAAGPVAEASPAGSGAPEGTANQAAQPGPVYQYRTLRDAATGVALSGSFTADATLLVTKNALHAKGACAACDEIRAQGSRVALYDVSITGGHSGPVELSLPVSSAYNGRAMTVLHCKHDHVERMALTARNGAVTGTFSSLSPFAVYSGGAPQTGDAGRYRLWACVAWVSGLSALCMGAWLVCKKAAQKRA